MMVLTIVTSLVVIVEAKIAVTAAAAAAVTMAAVVMPVVAGRSKGVPHTRDQPSDGSKPVLCTAATTATAAATPEGPSPIHSRVTNAQAASLASLQGWFNLGSIYDPNPSPNTNR